MFSGLLKNSVLVGQGGKQNPRLFTRKRISNISINLFNSYIIAIICYIKSCGGIMNLHHISIKTDPKQEKKMARKACVRLEKGFVNFKGSISISISINNELVELPVSIVNPLVDMLNDLSKGKIFGENEQDKILTTQQAANLLNVSRPFLVKLIETKELPSFKVGRNRRVYKSDLLSYKEKSLKERKEIMQKLVDEAQDLDLGY
jgi:excisionase family DNA binding protein